MLALPYFRLATGGLIEDCRMQLANSIDDCGLGNRIDKYRSDIGNQLPIANQEVGNERASESSC